MCKIRGIHESRMNVKKGQEEFMLGGFGFHSQKIKAF